MSKEVTEQEAYLDEWNKQFGNKEKEPEEKEEVEEEEVEQEEPEQEEEQEPEQEESEDAGEEEEKESAPPKQKSKDDEYREFIDSQPNERLKEQARKVIQGLKSADGRTSALQRRLNAREQLVQQLYHDSRQKAEPQKVPTSPRPDNQKDKGREPADELPEKFQALKKKNPEAAEIIDEIAKYRSDATAKQVQDIIDSRLGGIEQREAQNRVTEELNRLENKAKDLFEPYGMTARDIMQSEDFRAWVEIQRAESPGIYKLYEQAEDADSAYLILEKYENDYQKAVKEAGLFDDEDQTTNSNKGDEIRQRREKSKSAGRTPKSSRAGSPAKSRDNLSYEEEWKLMWGSRK